MKTRDYYTSVVCKAWQSINLNCHNVLGLIFSSVVVQHNALSSKSNKYTQKPSNCNCNCKWNQWWSNKICCLRRFSIYPASNVTREEFRDLDLTVRNADYDTPYWSLGQKKEHFIPVIRLVPVIKSWLGFSMLRFNVFLCLVRE